MNRSSCGGLLVAVLVTFVGVPGVWAQGNTTQAEGWQGPRPTPQQRAPLPTPQQPAPSGKQVLEIPSQPQQPVPALPTPQAVIPPRPQPAQGQPTQLITVTITDPQGHYIPGLRPEDFLLYEEDLPQKITYFNTGQDEPVSLGLLVDMSSSMLRKIARARQALRSFADAIHPQDEVFLEAFNQRPQLLQDFTDSRALLVQATALLQPLGETALYDAILDGLRRVKQGRCQKRALVVITDGMDTASSASLTETIEAVRRAGVMLYIIGIGDPASSSLAGGSWGARGPFMVRRGGRVNETVDSRTLQAFSDETGGKYFLLNTADVVGSAAVLDGATQTIADELRHQYSLGYRSPLKGDVYRSVRVETRRAGLLVRMPQGVD